MHRVVRAHQSGVILLAVLLFILVSSLAASTLVQSQSTRARREREEQLLFVGGQFRKAILSYYNTIPPGGARALPRSLDDLLTDNRFPMPVHHLRRVFLDPITGQKNWQLVMTGTSLVGVRSSSQELPMKQTGFARELRSFDNAQHYSDWVFRIQ